MQSLDEFVSFFFALVVVDVHHRKWKNIPPYNSNNNIYTYSTCVSCTNIILCGHIWNICHCYWTWQLLLFFHFHFIIFVFCVFRRYFFREKRRRRELLLQKRILKLQSNEQCLCGWFNLSNNVNIKPEPYILVGNFGDTWTKMANKLTYRYKHHNITKYDVKGGGESGTNSTLFYYSHFIYTNDICAAKTCHATVYFWVRVVFIRIVISLNNNNKKEKRRTTDCCEKRE